MFKKKSPFLKPEEVGDSLSLSQFIIIVSMIIISIGLIFGGWYFFRDTEVQEITPRPIVQIVVDEYSVEVSSQAGLTDWQFIGPIIFNNQTCNSELFSNFKDDIKSGNRADFTPDKSSENVPEATDVLYCFRALHEDIYIYKPYIQSID